MAAFPQALMGAARQRRSLHDMAAVLALLDGKGMETEEQLLMDVLQ
jgi:hypothetical protein